MLGHADRGEAVDAHAEAHLHVGPRGVADGVHGFVLLGAGKHEQAVLVPSHLMRLHPEGIHAYRVLWQLVPLVLRIGFGGTHQKLARWDRNHVVGNCRKRNGDLVRSRLLRVFFACTDLTQTDLTRSDTVVNPAHVGALARGFIRGAGSLRFYIGGKQHRSCHPPGAAEWGSHGPTPTW